VNIYAIERLACVAIIASVNFTDVSQTLLIEKTVSMSLRLIVHFYTTCTAW